MGEQSGVKEVLMVPLGLVGTLETCEPRDEKLYSCLNCLKSDFDAERCFTRWWNKYGLKQQPKMCPGYEPSNGANLTFTVKGYTL